MIYYADHDNDGMLEKSVVLIDAENVLNAWQSYCEEKNMPARIDYKKLVDKLSEGTNLLRAYFYDGSSSPISLKKKNFYEALQCHGIQLRTKMLRKRSYLCDHCHQRNERLVQKGVDVSLATDILRHAWQQTCQVCIIVSGDEDYKDAIEVAKDKGVKIWIASFQRSLAKDLRNNADKVILLETIFDDLKMDQKI
jgi:uncharacterized LabA/DUF88 family protein